MHVYRIDQEKELAVLRSTCQKVEDIDETLAETIAQMHEVMAEANGIGLAANQVGLPLRFFITNIDGKTPLTFINPQILATSLEVSSYEEGCLSIPQKRADVVRPSLVEVQAINAKGKVFTMEASNILGVCIQHEIDHLNGKLFLDHISKFKRQRILKQFKIKGEI